VWVRWNQIYACGLFLFSELFSVECLLAMSPGLIHCLRTLWALPPI
jgi:hypothetical protein